MNRGSTRRLATVAAAGIVAGALIGSPAEAQPAPEMGTLVVLNKAEATAWLIDVATGERLAVLPTGEGPHEVAISPDGRWAVGTDYGAQSGGNSLTIIDIEAGAVATTADLGEYGRPHGIAFVPGESRIAVTSETSQAVVFVEVPSGTITSAISTGQAGSHMLAMVESGARIYTGDIGSNTVSQLDVATGSRTATYDVPAQPEAITALPDGSEVWVGSNATGRVSVVDPSTGAVATAAEGFGWPYRILVSPDRRMVVIPDLRQHRVRFFDAGSKRELGEMDFAGAGPQGIIFGPDGRTLYLSLSAQGEVAVIDSRSRTVLRTIPAGEGPDGIGFSRLVHSR